MPDGTDRVEAAHFVASFVFENGKVVACAPILRRDFQRWKHLATPVPNPPQNEPFAIG